MIHIRMARPDDGAQVAAIYRPYVTDCATSFEFLPPDGAEMAGRIQAVLAFAPWLICEEGAGQAGALAGPAPGPPPEPGSDLDAGSRPPVLGYAYACRHRDRAAYQWSVDVAVYVRAQQHRRGIGRALYTSLFALLRLQGFYRAHAGITLPNPASVGLHEAMGFRPIGVYPAVGWKMGAWHDVGWWQLPLQPRPDAPARPTALAEVRVSPAWAATLRAGEEVGR